HVPRSLFDRPKQGFGVPIGDWLRGPLRSWAEDLLSEERLRRDGFLRPGPIRARWKEHVEGRRNWAAHLWNVVVLQQWFDAERHSKAGAIQDVPLLST